MYLLTKQSECNDDSPTHTGTTTVVEKKDTSAKHPQHDGRETATPRTRIALRSCERPPSSASPMRRVLVTVVHPAAAQWHHMVLVGATLGGDHVTVLHIHDSHSHCINGPSLTVPPTTHPTATIIQRFLLLQSRIGRRIIIQTSPMDPGICSMAF